MGLDFWDVTLRIEQEFGISLTDFGTESLPSERELEVGDLYFWLFRQLQLHDAAKRDLAFNRWHWQRMQSLLASVTQTDVESIELSTPLVTLFPRSQRCKMWEQLQRDCLLAPLKQPPSVSCCGLLAAGLLCVYTPLALLFEFHKHPNDFLWLIPLGLVISIWKSRSILRFLEYLWADFPKECVTVKDLCRSVLASNLTRLSEQSPITLVRAETRSSLEVFNQLRAVLVDCISVDADKVTLNAKFYSDLGAA